jgi:hypothetical protein
MKRTTIAAAVLMAFSLSAQADDPTLNVSIGAGVTRDTPDVSLTVRLPMNF